MDTRPGCPFPQERRYHLPDLTIDNCAMAGRSSRSFREEGRLADIEASLRPGDYLVVQFGHNDAYREKAERYVAPEAFGASLQPYLDAARRHGATCIFVSPVAMRIFDENGVCHPSFPEYREAMAGLPGRPARSGWTWAPPRRPRSRPPAPNTPNPSTCGTATSTTTPTCSRPAPCVLPAPLPVWCCKAPIPAWMF